VECFDNAVPNHTVRPKKKGIYMAKQLQVFLLVILITVLPAMASENGKTNKDEDTFRSPTAGFSVTKPKGWVFATTEQIATNRANVRLEDKELEEQMRQRASAPLIAIMKHEEPYDNLNPSVQVLLRPLGQLEGKSPLELMKIIIPSMQRAMVDFQFVEEIRETVVGGQKAAYVKSKYTVINVEGRTFQTLSRLWLIPRGKFMFMMSMSGTAEGSDVSEKEFADILKSIKIDS
jgi:hypothetical protein